MRSGRRPVRRTKQISRPLVLRTAKGPICSSLGRRRPKDGSISETKARPGQALTRLPGHWAAGMETTEGPSVVRGDSIFHSGQGYMDPLNWLQYQRRGRICLPAARPGAQPINCTDSLFAACSLSSIGRRRRSGAARGPSRLCPRGTLQWLRRAPAEARGPERAVTRYQGAGRSSVGLPHERQGAWREQGWTAIRRELQRRPGLDESGCTSRSPSAPASAPRGNKRWRSWAEATQHHRAFARAMRSSGGCRGPCTASGLFLRPGRVYE